MPTKGISVEFNGIFYIVPKPPPSRLCRLADCIKRHVFSQPSPVASSSPPVSATSNETLPPGAASVKPSSRSPSSRHDSPCLDQADDLEASNGEDLVCRLGSTRKHRPEIHNGRHVLQTSSCYDAADTYAPRHAVPSSTQTRESPHPSGHIPAEERYPVESPTAPSPCSSLPPAIMPFSSSKSSNPASDDRVSSTSPPSLAMHSKNENLRSVNLQENGDIGILFDVHGLVRPGESLAILGPSGSGKTSLLNLLSGTAQFELSAGQILFHGSPRNPRTKRQIGYVMQDDVFFSNLSVRQTLEFTAAIRLSDAMSKDQLRRRVDQVIARLRLEKCQHTRIGDQQFDKGISGGERKRVNIANELLADPALLLLDEPTSGLDASTALAVVRILRDLADEGKTVIATIHQPSSAMFGLFDKLMLLSEGRIAYFGPVSESRAYFSSIGYPFPNNYNPCDFLMQLVIDNVSVECSFITDTSKASAETSQQRLVRLWQERRAVQITCDDTRPCPQTATNLTWISPILGMSKGMGRAVAKRARVLVGKPDPLGLPEKYETSWWTQVRILAVRAIRQKRGKVIDIIQLQQLFAVIVISCLFWFRMAKTESTLNDRLGGLFFFAVFWAFTSAFSAIFAFPAEKAVLNKDRSSGAYRLSAYYFAKTLVETPADCIYPTIFAVIVYWIVGFSPDFWRFVVFLILLIVVVLTSQSFGLTISACMMDIRRAQVVATCVILASMLMAGYYINNRNIPSFVRPLRYLSYLKYGYEGMVRNEVSGQVYSCVGSGLSHTVYSQNGRDCPVSGHSVLVGANLADSLSIGGNLAVLVVWNILVRLVGYFGLKFLNINHKPKKIRL